MAISSETYKNVYVGDDITSVFPYTFKIFSQAEIEVIKYTIATGAQTVLALTTDYTVDGVGADAGGNITLTNPLPDEYDLIIRLKLPFTQGTDWEQNGNFSTAVLERSIDRVHQLLLQLKEVADRAVLQDPTLSAQVTMPVPSALAALRWKADLSGLENTVDPTVAAAAAAVSAAAAAGSAATATTQAGLAGAAKTNAETAEANAETAEANAETAQGLSESARDLAIAAKDTAVTNAGTATTQAGLAVAAKSAAEAARDLAIAAKDGADADAATTTADAATATAAKDDAVIAQGAAETAQGLAEDARDAAVIAKTAAEAAAGSYVKASQAEAEAGTEDTKFMTALKVNQAIQKRKLIVGTVSDAAGLVATDASLGDVFDLTPSASFTLSNPTNGRDGQGVIWRIKQPVGGGKVITLGNKFRLSSEIAAVVLSTAAAAIDHLGARYHSTDDKWDVEAFSTVFA